MPLPNKCPKCAMIVEAEEDSKIDPTKEVEMQAGNKTFSSLFENQPVYLPHESHTASKIRVVICANCGTVYAKEG